MGYDTMIKEIGNEGEGKGDKAKEAGIFVIICNSDIGNFIAYSF